MLLPVPLVRARQPVSVARLHEEALTFFMGCVSREPLLDGEDARDLAADVVTAILPKMGTIEDPLRYILAMSRNRLIRFLTRKRRQERKVAVWDSNVVEKVAEPDPVEEPMGDREVLQLALIRTHMQTTDPVTRQVLQWRYDAGLSFAQMAAMLECRPGRLRMRTLRFGQRVRTRWEQHYEMNTPRR